MPHPTPHPPERVFRNCDVIHLGGAPVPRVSAAAKAWNVAAALAGWAADRFRHVDRLTYAARLTACDTCPQRSGDFCSLCGCRLARKAKARAWHCPLGKWPGDPPPAPHALELAARREAGMRSLRLAFPHGFGDAVQLTTVLLHLQRLHNDWHVDVACKRGCGSLFRSLCRRACGLHELSGGGYAIDRTLPFPEPAECLPNCPSTKAEWTLKTVFGIEPIEALCRYEIRPAPDDFRRAAAWLRSIAEPIDGPAHSDAREGRCPTRFNTVLIHYQGNSARGNKNLDEQTVRRLPDVIRRRGFVPVVLDWERPFRSKLIDGQTVFCPDVGDPIWQGLRTGDGATLAALIAQSSYLIGIDSGPLHVAGATDTPTLAIWRRHHPLHYFALADNVLHLVPRDHERLLRGSHRDDGLAYFHRRYRHLVCRRHLRVELPALVDDELARLNCPEAIRC